MIRRAGRACYSDAFVEVAWYLDSGAALIGRLAGATRIVTTVNVSYAISIPRTMEVVSQVLRKCSKRGEREEKRGRRI